MTSQPTCYIPSKKEASPPGVQTPSLRVAFNFDLILRAITYELEQRS